jgi:TPR repeat protein
MRTLPPVLLLATLLWGCSGVESGVRAYERGDYPAALIEFRPLAEQGYTLAQYSLGLMYSEGHGVPQNANEAAKWFRRAASEGVPEAQFALGMLYFRGQGVPQDFVFAHMWMNLATAKARGQDAQLYRAQRDTVAVAMTREQIAEAQALARVWAAKHH